MDEFNPQEIAQGNFSSIAGPLGDAVDVLAAADPPDYLADYHDALVLSIQAQVEFFETGGIAALGGLDELTNFPEPTEAELQRFANAAGQVDACVESGFLN